MFSAWHAGLPSIYDNYGLIFLFSRGLLPLIIEGFYTCTSPTATRHGLYNLGFFNSNGVFSSLFDYMYSLFAEAFSFMIWRCFRITSYFLFSLTYTYFIEQHDGRKTYIPSRSFSPTAFAPSISQCLARPALRDYLINDEIPPTCRLFIVIIARQNLNDNAAARASRPE